jgi:predicted ATPase
MNSAVVGRDRELAAGEAFLDDLPRGARAMLIEGDPGIGKTAVWRAALAGAAARGYRVLRCVGEQAEARLSFVGLADLIGDAADEASLSGTERNALGRALLRRGSDRAADAKAIGVAFRALLVAFSLVGPVVVAVDDVQWLDGATAAVLAFAARRLQGYPVGVLATVRAPLSYADPLGLERAGT